MCRIYFPMNKTDKEHVLMESEDGITNHFFFDKEGEQCGVRDDKGEEIKIESPLENCKGSKHLMIMHDNKEITIYIDFIAYAKTEREKNEVIITKPIKFIGNSKDGNKPFGLISDFR